MYDRFVSGEEERGVRGEGITQGGWRRLWVGGGKGRRDVLMLC